MLENIKVFQKHLYSYLLNYTKDKTRIHVLSGKEVGAFESYRAVLHKNLNISEERRLDVEARVLNPRRAKSEKDVLAALQEWRPDQTWLVEAGFCNVYELLQKDGGRTAMTILVKMMPNEIRISFQRHLREHLSKVTNYDDLEEELHAEMYRRESEGDKESKNINQLENPKAANQEDNVVDEESSWVECWHPELG